LAGVGICALAAAYGLEAIGRCSQILVKIVVSLFIFLVVLMFPLFKPANLMPVLETPLPKLLLAGYESAIFPFGSTVVLLMILPYINGKQSAGLASFRAVILAGMLLIVSAIRIIGVLGPTAQLYFYPSFAATRLIDIQHFLTRLEVFPALIFWTAGFIRIVVLFYILALGTAQLLNLKSYRTLVIPLWLMVSLLSVQNFDTVTENLTFASKIFPFYATPLLVVFPLLTLTVAAIRRLRNGGG
jgi:spore germination protein KB